MRVPIVRGYCSRHRPLTRLMVASRHWDTESQLPTCFYALECKSKVQSRRRQIPNVFECQQRGHYDTECPSQTVDGTTRQSASQVNAVSVGPLAFAQVQVQGVTVKALIDSGSSVNTVYSTCVVRKGLSRAGV